MLRLQSCLPVSVVTGKCRSVILLFLSSVTTSFLAVYLTFRRSPGYALGYAANDVVLIMLWVLAALADPAYVSVAVCFAAFLVNDLYGFFSWRKMERRQREQEAVPPLGPELPGEPTGA